MIRVVMFAVILALGAGAMVLPASSAYAQEKKGFFGLFNRQGKSSNDGGPIHMSPGTQGASKGSNTKAYGFGKKNSKTQPRYEDSPINAERARQASNFAKWNNNELAKANARSQSLVEQMKAQQAYNAQIAQQQQAQKIAQTGHKLSAGPAPVGANPAVVQAMREGARAQAVNSMQGVAGMAPPVATKGATKAAPQSSPSSSSSSSAAPSPTEKTKRPPRSQGLFNRVTE